MKKLHLFCLLVGIAVTNSAHSNLIYDSNGQITGADNIVYSGLTYQVSFIDGICYEIFSGCDELNDFYISFDIGIDRLMKVASHPIPDIQPVVN